MRLLLKVVVAGVLLAVFAAAPALAQESGTYVEGNVIENDPAPPLEVGPADPNAAVLGSSQERNEGSSSTLPVTGGDVAALASIGVVLLIAGGAAVMVSRSRRLAPG